MNFLSRLLVLLLGVTAVQAADPVRVLILTGQNNHNWRETTPVMRRTLEDAGMTVEVTERPDLLDPASLERVDVVLSNWNTFGKQVTVTEWPEPLRKAVLDHVRKGKGFVVVHAGGSFFYDWDDVHKMIGATWGKGTGHGPIHEFTVTIADREHPVTRGLEDFKITDELWHRMVVNGDIHVLAEAFSARDQGGTHRNEPVAFTTRFGNGRCFNLVLGHAVRAMRNAGFQTLLVRGVRWAAGVSPDHPLPSPSRRIDPSVQQNKD